MSRSTQAELEQRINSVYLMLLRRDTRQTIVQFGSNKWGVGDRQIDDYIAIARKRMVAEASVERSSAMAEHLAIRRDLYNKAYRDKKWAIAFQIVQDEAKLIGLYFSLEDHIRAAISAGYHVYEPGSPEDQAASQAETDGFECEVEIGLASPPDASTPEPEAV